MISCFSRVSLLALLAGMVVFVPATVRCAVAGNAPPANADATWDKADTPRYMFTLSLPEFSMFNNALVSGLADRGGAAEIEVRIVNMPQATRPWWVISTENGDAVRVYRQWVSSELLDVVENTDFDYLDATTTRSLDSIGSLGRRLAYTLENPVWPIRRVTGTLDLDGAGARLVRDNGEALALTGDVQNLTTATNGLRVRASGALTAPGQFRVKRLADFSTNTLEIFTMPYCPYGQQAVPAVVTYLKERAAAGEPVPELQVRYIFYRISEDPLSEFYCLHGQKELEESVIQLLIRDLFQDEFTDYLLARFRNPEAPWEQLAVQAGIDESRVQEIAGLAESTARAVIEREYAYVHDLCGVENRSPTYFWKSQQIENPREAEPFRELDETTLPAGACSQ